MGLDAVFDHPFLLFVLAFPVLSLSAFAGALVRRLWRSLSADEEHEYDIVQSATLTLLGLIVGFSFSMAVNRYDARKTLEEAEANAIGTEFVRADLMPETMAGRTRDLLKTYLDLRIRDYAARDEAQLAPIGAETRKLQSELWSLARSAAQAQPTPITSLVVAGMNDVLNAQGYTQAAWWNRIPRPAWWLMALIAIGCNLLLGYGARRVNVAMFFIVPLTISTSFLLIADIDSPRGGVIRVLPQNLTSLAQSLGSP